MRPVSSRRFDGIDVLRGLSIVAVVVHHINIHMGARRAALAQALPRQVGAVLFWNGANGVTVFFAISGFLITTMTLRRWGSLSQVRVADFYRLRFARIVPLLVALLVILSALHLGRISGFVIKPETGLPRALLAAATFHINWLESRRGYLPGNWDVLWSLSVEEVFYLFFPLVCRLTKGRAPLWLMLSAFVAVGPFARTILTSNSLWADYGYLSCADGIALGCLAALIASRVRLGRATLIALQAIGIVLVLLVMTARPLVRAMHLYQTGLDVTCLAWGTCLLSIAIAQREKTGAWRTAVLRWFGRNSYEVYLTHMFVVTFGTMILLAAQVRPIWAAGWYAAMLMLAGVVGDLVARMYSEPLNRRLRQFWRTEATTEIPIAESPANAAGDSR